MRKPVIAVVPLWDEEKNSLWMVPGYMKGIKMAGGIPVILPLTADREVLVQAAERFDGFLFTGGQDVSPHLYGEEPLEQCGQLCEMRDRMERVLFEQAVKVLDKPVFGICRGIQMINVILGGTLYQDLPTQYGSETKHCQMPPYDAPVHGVSLLPDTPLKELLKRDQLPVNSYHHQAVRRLTDQLVPLAVSEDNLIEAAYMPERRFVYAVQWHPELTLEDNCSQLLFESFVKACK